MSIHIFLLPLPLDICKHIYYFHLFNNVNIIISYWYKYIKKKINIIYKIIKINKFNPRSKEQSDIFYNARNIISGKEDYDWWCNVIIKLANSINYHLYNLYCDNNYINSIIYSCKVLAYKFNISSKIDNIINRYYL